MTVSPSVRIKISGARGPGLTAADLATLNQAVADAEAAASLAESVAGPTYPDTAAGLAATTDGESFAVDNGDGTVTIYLNDGGSAVEQRTLATTTALAGDGGAGMIGIKRDAAGTVGLSVADLILPSVSILEFGAAFDVGIVPNIGAATDDTAAWQAALAYLVTVGGGTLTLPPGASKVTSVIDIPVTVPIRIVGSGQRKVYPGLFAVGTGGPSTVVPVHTGRSTFRFFGSAAGEGSFCGENFNIATLETGDVPDCGFGWETQGGFLYGFTFRQMGIHGFKKAGQGSAFDVYKTGGTENAVGAVLIDNCTINRNNWVARTLNSTQFNGFWFCNNKAGQNGSAAGTGGINISGHGVSIEDNILEGQRDPVHVFGGYRNVTIRNNHFEVVTGDACIKLMDVIGPFDIGPNLYLNMNYANLKQNVILRYTGIGRCIDPYWSEGTHKMAPALLGTMAENTLSNTAGTDDFGFYRLDRMQDGDYLVKPNALASQGARVTIAAREQSPVTGGAMPVAEYTTTGSGIFTTTRTLSGSSGQWALASVLFKRIADAGPIENPMITLNVNNSTGAGTRSNIAYNFNRYFADGEWVLFTAAIKLGTAMTSLGIYFYPFGINPTAGRVARLLLPYACVLDDINKARPYIDSFLAHSVTAAPAAGAWLTGDKLDGSDGTMRICTAGGSPGTWGSVVPS